MAYTAKGRHCHGKEVLISKNSGRKVRRRWAAPIAAAVCIMLMYPVGSVAIEENLAPRIEFDAREKELGTIEEGGNKKFEFLVRNTGNADLRIFRLRALCDCTEVRITSATIAPGETATIHGTFRSAGRWGEQEKVIVVSSNAGNAPESALKIHLLIESGIRVTPRSFAFGEIELKGSITKTVTIEAELEKELKIRDLTIVGTDAVTARVEKRKVKSVRLPNLRKGFLTRFDISLTAANKTAGEFSGELRLETDSQKSPLIRVLFSGERAGDIDVLPVLAKFRAPTPRESVTVVVTLTSATSQEFVVAGIDSANLPISLEASPKIAARQQKVTLAFTAPDDPRPFYRGYIYLLTDHPTQKRVKVGINAVTRRAPGNTVGGLK